MLGPFFVIGKNNFFPLELNCVLGFLICNSSEKISLHCREELDSQFFPRFHLSASCDVDSAQVR